MSAPSPKALRRTAFAAALALGGAACNSYSTDPGGVICTRIAVAGINLTVVDSVTGMSGMSGNPTAFTGLWARAVDGAYRDSSTFFFTNPTTGAVTGGLAYEHKGTHTVTVRANGYQEWSKSGVVVTADVCHVIGVQLTARLVK